MVPGMGGFGRGDRRTSPARPSDSSKAPKRPQSERLRDLWPDLREMIQPRRKIFAIGFVLMIINRVCGMVLPTSTKYLIDNVIGKRQEHLLMPLVGAVLLATLIQGVTS